MKIVPSLSPFSHVACRVETKKLPAFHIEKCGGAGCYMLS